MISGKVLITGASGLLGKYLIRTNPGYELLRCRKQSVVPTGYIDMDITNPSLVDEVMQRHKPDVVIHCAAIGSVDYCEEHFHYAHEVNVVGTWNVAMAANKVGAKLVFISSNAVYRGDSPPYGRVAKQFPVNVYGLVKKQAENVVRFVYRQESFHASIVRPVMLYGWPNSNGRKNFVQLVVEALRDNKIFYVMEKINTQPTHAECCAKTIWEIVGGEYWGSINIAGPDVVSLTSFAYAIAKAFELDATLIKTVAPEHFSGVAPRPLSAIYRHMRAELVPMLHVHKGLECMKENISID